MGKTCFNLQLTHTLMAHAEACSCTRVSGFKAQVELAVLAADTIHSYIIHYTSTKLYEFEDITNLINSAKFHVSW